MPKNKQLQLQQLWRGRNTAQVCRRVAPRDRKSLGPVNGSWVRPSIVTGQAHKWSDARGLRLRSVNDKSFNKPRKETTVYQPNAVGKELSRRVIDVVENQRAERAGRILKKKLT